MIQTRLPCVNTPSWRWDLDHADHERIIGPCLSCSEAVAGCSTCPLQSQCETIPSPGTIRGGVAWLDVPIHGRKTAYECVECGNPILTRYQRRYCSVSCRKDYEWTYREAAEQEKRFRLAHSTTTARAP